MFDFIMIPMWHVLKVIYDTVALKNYGIAIILFTAAVNMFLLSLTIKRYHSMTQIGELQPQMQ